MKTFKILAFIFVLGILSACATRKSQYLNPDPDKVPFPDQEVERTFYFIGEAGKQATGAISGGLKALSSHLERVSKTQDYTIFLGDNTHPASWSDQKDKERNEAEIALKRQVNAVSAFKGKTIFIPGNHDWNNFGLTGLKRQETYIKGLLGENAFLPENGCPISSIAVSETVQLVIIDTQWYLEDWNFHPEINDACAIKTREDFFKAVQKVFKKAQDKTILVAMHHPILTNGVYGGKYALNTHIYPFRERIPLPILGSFIAQVRSQGGISNQDINNTRYTALRKRLKILALGIDRVVFISGHEQTLQYLEESPVKQIVSGSGSKAAFAELGSTGLFSSGAQGFAALTVFKDGSTWLRFYEEDHGTAKLIFTKRIFSATKAFDVSALPDRFPQSIETTIYPNTDTQVSGVYKTFWGSHYRDLYGTKIKVKVATLDTLYGGLTVLRKGEGFQTHLLELQAKDGRIFSMRALKKSATQYLQSAIFKDNYIHNDFDETVLEALVLDFYTASHPFTFSIVPTLSDAAQVLHGNAKLLFIPKHKDLGDFNKNFGDALYLIEEYPSEKSIHTPTFAFADGIESTKNVIENIREDERYKINESAYVRARLFDMLLGDWNRTPDQWRWARFDEENGNKYYQPIARTRDQVFSNFDGSILDVSRLFSSAAQQLQVYDEDIKHIEAMNISSIKLDRILLKQSIKSTWIEQARFLQDYITDEVIEKAFSKVPDAAKGRSLNAIKNKLKGRRGHLLDIANRYHEYLSKLVVLTGTDKADHIEITRNAQKETNIKISRNFGAEQSTLLVDKTFNKAATKEIWIYGLDDEDVFEVSGEAKNPIFIRLIGGQGNDTYSIQNGKQIKVYDHKSKENTIKENNGASVRFTDLYQLNLFDIDKDIQKSNLITPFMGFNPDDGFLLGVSGIFTTKGFQRNPFSKQHRFKGGYYFATKGFMLRYNGEFAYIFRDWNLQLGGKYTTTQFTTNFFGFGNETAHVVSQDYLDFNRVRTSIFEAKVGVVKTGNLARNYGVSTLLEGIRIEDTPNRFLTQNVVPDSNAAFYERRFFGGFQGHLNYSSYDNKVNPKRGMRFKLELGSKLEFKALKNSYAYLNSDIGFYNALTKNKRWVLKTDLKTQFRSGTRLIFYQAATIGGNNGLRGYRNERFTGQHALVGSTDIRYSFPSIKTKALPIQIGVFTGMDVGRVWVKNESSAKWHSDYGAGFWVNAAETLSGSFGVFNSNENVRATLGFVFNF